MKKVLMGVMVICLGLVGSANAGSLVGDMVGYWPMDGNANDISIHGYNGTIVGSPRETTQDPNDILGTALDFNGDGGNDDHIDVGKKASELGIGGNNPKSVSCWAYTRGFNAGGLFDVGNLGNDQDFSLRTLQDGESGVNGGVGINTWRIQYWAGDLDFNTLTGEGMVGGATPFTSQNTWVHFVLAYDGSASGNTKVWANGNLIVDWNRSPVINTPDNNTFKWAFWRTDDNDRLDGILDEAGLWSRALDQSDVDKLYNSGAGAAPVDYRATGPVSPANDPVTVITVNPITLNWNAGTGVTVLSHNVYLGTDPDAVANANADSTEFYQNVAAPASSLLVSGLTQDATYYWRVDECDTANTHDPNLCAKGEVWAFSGDLSPEITLQPVDQVSFVGGGAIFTMAAISENTPITSYQWLKDGSPLSDLLGKIEGATTDRLKVADVQVADVAGYRCVVTNSAGSKATNIAQLTIANLLAHWDFEDEAKGGPSDPNVYDISGNDHHGVIVNTASYTDSFPGLGRAMDFNGTGYIETSKTGTQIGINANNPRTITCWTYVRQFTNAAPYDYGNYDTLQDFSLRTLDWASHRWRVQYWGSDWDIQTDNRSGFTTDAPGFSSLNAWVFWVHTHDGTTTRLYGNGFYMMEWDVTLQTADTTTFRMGWWNGDQLFGIVDDVRIYDKALSQNTALDMYIDVWGSFCAFPPEGDITGPGGYKDCLVNLYDMAALLDEWLACSILPASECP